MSGGGHKPRPSSMVMTRIGGTEYPLRSMPQCHTCQSPHRLMIENELIRGRSYASVARSLEGLEPGEMGHPSSDSISNHVHNGHVPIGVSAQRRLIERRAQEVGRSIEDSQDTLVDYVTINQMVVHRGFERMQAGEISPDIADVLAASRFLHQVEQSADGGLDQQTFMDALHAYMEVAQAFIPRERWQEYGAALSQHPVLLAMTKANERKAIAAPDEDED